MAPKKKMEFSQSGSNQPGSPDRRSSTPMQRLQPGGATAPQAAARKHVRMRKDDGGTTVSRQRYTDSRRRRRPYESHQRWPKILQPYDENQQRRLKILQPYDENQQRRLKILQPYDENQQRCPKIRQPYDENQQQRSENQQRRFESPQRHSESPQRCPKIRQRCDENQQRRPKIRHRHPKIRHQRSESPQRCSEGPQRCSESPQRCSEGPQRCSEGPQRCSESPQRCDVEHELHRFIVKYSQSDASEYPFDCDQPCTVLEALKSTETYQEKIKYCDENVVIQLGKEDGKAIVATHFPCTCIEEGEVLIVSSNPKTVEEAKDQTSKIIHSKDKYSVFFIDTVGGKYTRQKKLFRNNAVKGFKYLCVYGEKGMTVEEALKRDGRFIDDLTNFTLTDNDNPNSIVKCSQIVDKLDKKSFKICLPRKKKDKKQQEEPQGQFDRRSAGSEGVARQRGVSVRAEAEKNGGTVDTQEIYERLCQQFPDLKKLMESRFPGDSYQKALSLRKENFGKIQNSFSEIHRVEKLLKLGESVCKVVIQDSAVWITGSGFVLFDNFILTNAHLFKNCVEGETLKEGINVSAVFNYKVPESQINYYDFKLAHRNIFSQGDLDYAIFEINPHESEGKTAKVPRGLLKNFGGIPPNGEGCIIGHPGGNVKEIDLISIIKKEDREQAVNSNLADFKGYPITLCAINHSSKNDPCADTIMTYNSFMYHGSSGSPVFDARGRVYGLHTAGFFFGFPKPGESVIEFANPLLRIFENFVTKLKEQGNQGLLNRIKKEIKGNSDLKKVFRVVTGTDEFMETD